MTVTPITYYLPTTGSRLRISLPCCLALLRPSQPEHEQGDRATQAVLTCRSHLVKGTIYYGTHYYSASRPETEGAPFLFGRDDNSSGCGCLGMRVGGAAVMPLVSAGLACVSDNAVGRSTRPVLVFDPDSLSWASFRPHENVACDKVKHCPTFRIEIGP